MGTTINEYPEGLDPYACNKCCKNCRYFCPYVYEFDIDQSLPDAEDQLVSDYGECRRYPPKTVGPQETAFPVVNENAWCGEFDI